MSNVLSNIEVNSYGIQKIKNEGGGTGPTGTINITTNGNHNVTNYATASVSVPNVPEWSQIGYETIDQNKVLSDFNYSKEIFDNWDNTVSDISNMFKDDMQLTFFPKVDTSNVRKMNNIFENCRGLRYLGNIDTSNVTEMSKAFASVCVRDFSSLNTSNVTNFASAFINNKCLVTFPAIDTSNATNVTSMFQDCSKLQNVPIFDFGKVKYLGSMFGACSVLNSVSLNNIMASLLTATEYTGTKTLRQAGLSSAQADSCTNLSNWADLSEAGWTTGY